MKSLLFSTFRAIQSLFTPGMMGIFIKSILLTVFMLIGFIIGSTLFFNWLAEALHGHAMASFLPWIGSIGAGVIAWMLFPGIMPIIVSFFDNRIAMIIEEHDYPETIQRTDHAFWPELWHDVRFAVVAISLNILVLPLYLLPVINLVLFYWLNGYLLGREFFSMVARRHLGPRDSNAMYRRHRLVIIIAGMALTMLATIPVANLFAPFWGIAVMVHLYHRLEPTVKIERVTRRSPGQP